MTFVVLNPNTTKNAKLIYCAPGYAVDCIPVFFSPVFEVHFDGSPKGLALKIFISIPLKCIGSDLAIVLVTHDGF